MGPCELYLHPVCVFFNENNIRVHDFLSLRAAGARLVQDENGGHKSAVSRGRGRGRATEKADERGDLPRTMRDAGGVSRQKAEVGGVRPSNAADDYIGEDGEDDDDDDETEAFKDEIMKQLEEKAFSVEEAHNILTIQFGTSSGDRVKDAVLAEWCGEVGLTASVEHMSTDDRLEALDKVSRWLFQ